MQLKLFYFTMWLLSFLLRDAMRKHSLYFRPVSVCLSVRPSDTFVYCMQTAEDCAKRLSRPGIPIILYDSEHRYPIPRGISSSGAL